jgi:hypothetical protein
MALLSRCRPAAVALTLALMAVPVLAESPQRQPAAKTERAAGLRVYTADGKAIGRVIASGLDDDNRPVLVAEIERPLGLGPQAIAIPTDLFVRRRDRIQLRLTEAEVNARLGR